MPNRNKEPEHDVGDAYEPVVYKRRKEDSNWFKAHHFLVSYAVAIAGMGVWVFTTFAQVNWVNAENRKQDEMFELQIHEANKKMDYLIRLNEQQQVETSRIKETLFTLARDRR